MSTESPLVEFTLSRPADVTHLGRRVKLLAALSELSHKQRGDLSKAVTRICRHLVANGSTAKVAFTLTGSRKQRFIEVTVLNTGDENGTPAKKRDTQKTEDAPEESLHEIEGLIDSLELDGWPGTGAVARLRQMLSPTFEIPSPAETRLWVRMAQQKSLEDAILVARQRGSAMETEADGIRQRQRFREELDAGLGDAESREFLALVATATDNLIAVLDGDGSFRWVNEAAIRTTGHSRQELLGLKIDELFISEDRNSERVRDLRESLRLGHKFSDELCLRRKNGTEAWLLLTLTPVRDASGQVARWTVVGVDSTRRRQAVDALEASRRAAEDASRSKSDFLANMSHEIRTPLNAIIGMTELALGTELTREQYEYLTTVKMSAESLLELLNDILDLSKIEAGKLTIDETDFNLAELLRDTSRSLAVRAHMKGLELACHLPLDIPQSLRGDPTRLRQVLVNLIGNAIKFTDEGEIIIEVEQQWRTDDEIGLHFSVRDTGVGIGPDQLEKIFEAFEQGDTSTTRRFGGTGLGLTITARLLRMMGGRIWVESREGTGSTFHFSLRFPIAETPVGGAERAEADALEGMTVLAVDDNATNRRILEELLKHWKMRPVLAADGREALEEVRRAAKQGRPFEIVLLDAMLPDLDGFEVAREIRQRPELECGTVMMLSSADRPGSTAKCQELGIAAYLTKPISQSTLLDTILSAIGNADVVPERKQVSEEGFTEPPRRELYVVVADDHEANRRLATRVLQKRGHQCIPATNGNDVLEILNNQPVDVVLMDIQMPERDGIQTTADIRARERDDGGHLPIIALTAHAMKGDREKCLAAGMDAYLSKPLRSRELVTLVESVTARHGDSTAAVHRRQSIPETESDAIDFDSILERLDGDREMLEEQIEYFQRDAPALLAEIESALNNEDGQRLQRAAHKLKGQLAGFHDSASVDLAAAFEQYGRGNDSTTDVRETLLKLNERVEMILRELSEFSSRAANQE